MALPIPAGAPGGGPEPPPAPPAAPAAPMRPRTYRELFTDEENGPAPGRLAEYLAGYRFDGGAGVPTPATLRDGGRALRHRRDRNSASHDEIP